MQKLQGTQRFALYMLSVKYQPLDSDLGYINHVRVDLSALARQFATNPVVNTRLIASRNNTILSDRSSRTEKKRNMLLFGVGCIHFVVTGTHFYYLKNVIVWGKKIRPGWQRTNRERKIKTRDRARTTRKTLWQINKRERGLSTSGSFVALLGLVHIAHLKQTKEHHQVAGQFPRTLFDYDGSQSTYRKSPTAF